VSGGAGYETNLFMCIWSARLQTLRARGWQEGVLRVCKRLRIVCIRWCVLRLPRPLPLCAISGRICPMYYVPVGVYGRGRVLLGRTYAKRTCVRCPRAIRACYCQACPRAISGVLLGAYYVGGALRAISALLGRALPLPLPRAISGAIRRAISGVLRGHRYPCPCGAPRYPCPHVLRLPPGCVLLGVLLARAPAHVLRVPLPRCPALPPLCSGAPCY
jgi:hypothetical protein